MFYILKNEDGYELLESGAIQHGGGKGFKSKEEAAESLCLDSDYFHEIKPSVIAERQNAAFIKLIGAFTVSGSYPNKQKAMTDAIAALPESATSNELYEEAVKLLG